jgi:hypothetical protein
VIFPETLLSAACFSWKKNLENFLGKNYNRAGYDPIGPASGPERRRPAGTAWHAVEMTSTIFPPDFSGPQRRPRVKTAREAARSPIEKSQALEIEISFTWPNVQCVLRPRPPKTKK